jgi:leader peptidase (prepilin peptidase)/N-methyltransferase
VIVAADVGLRAAAVVGGLGVGVIAVFLAQTIPHRMGNEPRERPLVWWAVAVTAGAGYGWQAADASAGWALLPAYLAFGLTTLAVTLTDLDHRLIPNRILYPGFVVSGLLLTFGAMAEGLGRYMVRAGAAAVAYFLLLLIIALVVPGGFGMGDVKLALLLGLVLGFLGWDVLGVGFTVGILLGGVASVLLLVFTSRGRKAKFAYGPYMVAGAWIGLFWGPQIADWYLRSGS